MNFDAIYNKKSTFYPEEIDISDGDETQGVDGFKSDKLWTLYEKAEDLITNQAESYFVWAYYRLLHRKSKTYFRKQIHFFETSEINREELYDEYKIVIDEGEKINKIDFCCDMMKYEFSKDCEIHDSKYDCPDRLIDYNDNSRAYTLIIHDGGSAGIKIKYCPWCGGKL